MTPIVIAHRGASGYRPEHTLAAYELAIAQGTDYIEPDLVITRDGVLVIRHENEISGTTDVADHPEFGDRYTTKPIDGQCVTGWFTEDFTLAELKTLRVKERLPGRNQSFNGQWTIPTLEEAIALVQEYQKHTGRSLGLYLETKHPSYFRSLGLPLEEPLLRLLTAHGYNHAQAPVFIQSFEVTNLQELHQRTALPLIQLLGSPDSRPYDWTASGDARTYADLGTPQGLAGVAQYAAGVGPAKQWIVPTDTEGHLQAPTPLIEMAHAAGLLVHAYTFRSDAEFLSRDYPDPEAEYAQFFTLGVDGVFSDFPDTAVAVRDRLQFATVGESNRSQP